MANVAIVHGHKLLPDGRIDEGYKSILNKAGELITDRKIEFLILTGGVTRAGFGSEAAAGLNYLYNKLGVTKVRSVHIVVEERSTTFSENVQKCIDKLAAEEPGITVEKAYLIARRSAEERVMFLYDHFWHASVGKAAEYVPIDIPETRLERLQEWISLRVAKRDPEERGLIIRTLKTLRRNQKENQKLATI